MCVVVFIPIMSLYTLHPSQNALIEHIIQQDSISATTIDILSASIHGEAQQVVYTPEAIDHMEQVVNLLNSRDDAVQNIDEQDAQVRTTIYNKKCHCLKPIHNACSVAACEINISRINACKWPISTEAKRVMPTHTECIICT